MKFEFHADLHRFSAHDMRISCANGDRLICAYQAKSICKLTPPSRMVTQRSVHAAMQLALLYRADQLRAGSLGSLRIITRKATLSAYLTGLFDGEEPQGALRLVEAVVQAYAAGQISLDRPPSRTSRDRLRFALSFVKNQRVADGRADPNDHQQQQIVFARGGTAPALSLMNGLADRDGRLLPVRPGPSTSPATPSRSKQGSVSRAAKGSKGGSRSAGRFKIRGKDPARCHGYRADPSTRSARRAACVVMQHLIEHRRRQLCGSTRVLRQRRRRPAGAA